MVFGVAILAAVTRTAIRIHLKQRLQIDDGFLFLACVCLIATTILLYKMVTDIYFFQSLSSDPSAVAIPMDIVSRIDWFQKSDSAYLFVTWTAHFRREVLIPSVFQTFNRSPKEHHYLLEGCYRLHSLCFRVLCL